MGSQERAQRADELEDSWVEALDAALQEPIRVDLDNLPAVDNTERSEVIEVKDDEEDVEEVIEDSGEANSVNKVKEEEEPTRSTQLISVEPGQYQVKRPKWAAGVLRRPPGVAWLTSGEWVQTDRVRDWSE